jgi:hypothetical protein
MELTFPRQAVRGLAIRTGTAANCVPDHTDFTLDFEPLHEPGFEYVSGLDYGLDDYYLTLHQECAPAIGLGVRLNLGGVPKPARFGSLVLSDVGPRLDDSADGPLIAVRVVLTKVRYDGVDSAPGPHCTAAWELAQQVREQLG